MLCSLPALLRGVLLGLSLYAAPTVAPLDSPSHIALPAIKPGLTTARPAARVVRVLCGESSAYGRHDGTEGRPTASGRIFHAADPVCAMRAPVPLGSVVRVTRGTRTVVLLCCDRGPYARATGRRYRGQLRAIDVSESAAEALGFGGGIADVTVEVLAGSFW